MLSLLHLIQAQTDCFLLHCDCTIDRCCTVVSYSISYHQWRRLTQMHIAFCLHVIRLANTHTDKKDRKAKQNETNYFRKEKRIHEWFNCCCSYWSYYHSFHKWVQFDKSISKLKRHHLHSHTYSYVSFFIWFYILTYLPTDVFESLLDQRKFVNVFFLSMYDLFTYFCMKKNSRRFFEKNQ
jgi:hypothetical protein